MGLIQPFELPSGESSSTSSSADSLSSEAFWLSPSRSRWSRFRSAVRNTFTKRQSGVIVCLFLVLLVWIIPHPRIWRREVIHITVQHPVSNPYQVLRPALETPSTRKSVPDPARWLDRNSNNRHAENTEVGLFKSVPSLGHYSAKPRAALISLVRNSELDGIVQSMRQLEYRWNRKYNYPWVFFNEEPFSEEFKACCPSSPTGTLTDENIGSHSEPHQSQVLLRNRPYRALVTARLDRRRAVYEQSRIPGRHRRW